MSIPHPCPCAVCGSAERYWWWHIIVTCQGQYSGPLLQIEMTINVAIAITITIATATAAIIALHGAIFHVSVHVRGDV